MEPDLAMFDTLDDVLSLLPADERLEVMVELESDGLWDERLHNNE